MERFNWGCGSIVVKFSAELEVILKQPNFFYVTIVVIIVKHYLNTFRFFFSLMQQNYQTKKKPSRLVVLYFPVKLVWIWLIKNFKLNILLDYIKTIKAKKQTNSIIQEEEHEKEQFPLRYLTNLAINAKCRSKKEKTTTSAKFFHVTHAIFQHNTTEWLTILVVVILIKRKTYSSL